jgi:hypothetical protein
MRLRNSLLGHDPALKEKPLPLASEQSQGRRRAVRAKSRATLHKVGCSWPARALGVLAPGSAGPTTPPRFEPSASTPSARPAGEPTVSHEGCSGSGLSFILSARFPGRTLHVLGLKKEPFPLASEQSQGRRRAVRAKSQAILHKVGCSWPARPVDIMLDGSAGPTTPPRFEPSSMMSTGRPAGEPTVSHEGCSGRGSFFIFSASRVFGLEEESNPLASEQSQGRRRAVRAKSQAILHKVGCSWRARVPGIQLLGSAGPTTPPRFEPSNWMPGTRPAGEPTVSHEGCSGFDFSSVFLIEVAHG